MISHNRSDLRGQVGFGAAIVAALLLGWVAFAHADTGATSAPTVGIDWLLYLGIAIAALGGLETMLRGLSMLGHAISPRTKTTIDDSITSGVDALHDKVDRLERLLVQINSTPLPSAPAVRVIPGGGTAAMLALLIIGTMAAGSLSCTTAQLRTGAANGVGAFLDCEAAGLPKDTLADAVTLAKGDVMGAISGSGRVDASKIKADVSSLKTDLGRCAFAGAIAALATPAPEPQPGAPASSELVVDGKALRSAFTVARNASGWPVVRVAGEVL